MRAVSHPGSLRNASFASCVNSALLFPIVVIQAAGQRVSKQPRSMSPTFHAGGIRPRRLAMILSTIRFGSTDVIMCRIGSGVIW